ncbi:MAG: hotdog fold thioesterase [Rhodanobacteraceae bacterium]|nr:hotdog fold thioesterase [Rhodanobacteraceae bacterium]
MALWQKPLTPEQLRELSRDTIHEPLGIEITEIGEDFVRGRMPVDQRTRQPYGLLHGGASVVLAESLGSIGAGLVVAGSGARVVGLDINANHLRAVRDGWVTGTARPLHIGRTTQVWEIRLENDAGELSCIARLTMAVVQKAP